MEKTESKRIRLAGVITASEWDEEGNPRTLVLNSYREREFQIAGGTGIEELFACIGASVELFAYWVSNSGNGGTIQVDCFSVLEDDSDSLCDFDPDFSSRENRTDRISKAMKRDLRRGFSQML